MVESEEVPSLHSTNQETLALTHQLFNDIEFFRRLRSDWFGVDRLWAPSMRNRLKANDKDDILNMLEALGSELEQIDKIWDKFVKKPVTIVPGAESDETFVAAIRNLATGQRAFGLVAGLFGKSKWKASIASTRVSGTEPRFPDDWSHVRDYIELLLSIRKFVARWNALCGEFQFQTISVDGPDSFIKTKNLVKAEINLCTLASQLFPQQINSDSDLSGFAALSITNRKEQGQMTKRPRRNHSPTFKAKVALDALKGEQTIIELSQRYQVHPHLVTEWKKQLLEHASDVFSKNRGTNEDSDIKVLHAKIGQLAMENDFLSRALGRIGDPSAKK